MLDPGHHRPHADVDPFATSGGRDIVESGGGIEVARVLLEEEDLAVAVLVLDGTGEIERGLARGQRREPLA